MNWRSDVHWGLDADWGLCGGGANKYYIGEQLSSITSTYFANLQVPVQCVISLRFAIGVSGYSVS